jgi:hypothetical protein
MTARQWLGGLLQLLAALGCGNSAAANALAPRASVELIHMTPAPGLAGLPPGAPKPVLYFRDKARAPSCGLLPAGSATAPITPMLEPEPNEDFPACLEVTDGAVFTLGADTAYVFKYRQRDTREDSSTGYFFVRQTAAELRPVVELSGATVPFYKSIRSVAAWAKSRLVSLANEKDGYQTSAPDSINVDAGFLNLSRNAAAARCRTVVGGVAAPGRAASATLPCKAVVASTAWAHEQAWYFIVLFQNDAGQSQGQVFVVTGDGAREATELEAKLTAAIGSGKVLAVKEALRKAVESR